MAREIEVGDIFLSSCHYGMTIYNFFRVKCVTDKTITFEKLLKVPIGYTDPGYNQNPIVTIARDSLGVIVDTKTRTFRRSYKEDTSYVKGLGYDSINIRRPLTEADFKKGFAENHMD